MSNADTFEVEMTPVPVAGSWLFEVDLWFKIRWTLLVAPEIWLCGYRDVE